jgi:uncharacterized membrane protein
MNVYSIGRINGWLFTFLAISSILLSACTGLSSSAPLTPQQQALRDEQSRWYQTTATGTLGGAVVGGTIGALVLKKNRLLGGTIGAILGGLAGLFAGKSIANRNMAFENREKTANERIADAKNLANRMEASANSAEQTVQSNRELIAQLNNQALTGRLSKDSYAERISAMRQDLAIIYDTAGEADIAREKMLQASVNLPGLRLQEERMKSSQDRLERSAAEIKLLLDKIPTA